ncbi:unnamed protein product [Cylindrotheca closterium]|uniref:Uncharacterized protein n=1 Tax=Cylindrotheca closterium TaxID=2856 RepID=A0AAD2G153_9STRA|nr:unnamed protein product [Cylindrotheca closterium]
MSIFLKKDRPNAKSTYYGSSLPARIRNGWNYSGNNNKKSSASSSSANNNASNHIRGGWRNMRARTSEKDKENHFGNRPGEHVTIEKDNQNHEEEAYCNAENTSATNHVIDIGNSNDATNNKSSGVGRARGGGGGGGGGPIGTEAMIEQHLERNSKLFKYPPQGYWTRIELSILYSMVLEPTIFPASAVCEHIQQSQQEFADAAADADAHRKTDPQQPQHFMEPYLYERPPPGQYTAQMTVSYQQFVALLVLAGEEWPAESKVPQLLCQSMVQCIVQYADRHGLDRQVELNQGLQKPLEQYSRKRGAKITLSSMWPVYVGAITTALTGTALPLGISYVASFALNEKHVQKECVAEENRLHYQLSMERAANPEHESLLDDIDHYDAYYHEEEEEEIQLWDDDEKDEKKEKKKNSGLFDDDDNNDEDYSFVAQEVKQQQQHQQQSKKTPTSALAGAGSMLLLGNSIRAQHQDEPVKKPAVYVKAVSTVDSSDEDDGDGDDLL